MNYLKDKSGFTLIELAIVLIIIGIILGAVLKGQDLIENSRIKQFITKVRAWEVAQWNYYDRKGRFAGDGDSNGVIGDGNVKDDLTNATFIEPPYDNDQNVIRIGSQSFYVFFGNDSGSPARNIMIICANNDCNSQFSNQQVPYLESLDSVIDGTSNGSGGRLIGYNGTVNGNNTTWVGGNISLTQGSIGAWSNSTKAALYYFDSKRPQ